MYHRPGLINHNYTPTVLRSSCLGVTVLLRMRNTLITASHLSTLAYEHKAFARGRDAGRHPCIKIAISDLVPKTLPS